MPRKKIVNMEKVHKMLEKGKTITEIAKRQKVSRQIIHRYLAQERPDRTLLLHQIEEMILKLDAQRLKSFKSKRSRESKVMTEAQRLLMEIKKGF